jgi:hypothetical protein
VLIFASIYTTHHRGASVSEGRAAMLRRGVILFVLAALFVSVISVAGI